MGARAKYPDLKRLEPVYLAELLERSNLSASDRQIAVSMIQWDMTFVEIGAALGESDRTRELYSSTGGTEVAGRADMGWLTQGILDRLAALESAAVS